MPLPHRSRACTELVASVLKVGGLLDANCNPGSATPEMLHRIYAARGAASANPCILREINGGVSTGNALGVSAFIGNLTQSERVAEREALMASSPSTHGTGVPRQGPVSLTSVTPQPLFQPARRRADSPPRGHFHAVNREYAPMGVSRGGGGGACSSRCITSGGIQLTMDSLKFGGSKQRPR